MTSKIAKWQLLVQNTVVSFTRIQQGDFISLTDIAKAKNPDEPKDVVKNWLRSRSTLDFLGLWEQINNPGFKGVEFDSFKNQAGTNSFTLSPSKWIEATGAIGIRSTAGRTGGTYAHQDIPQSARLLALNNTAIHQMRSLLGNVAVLKIK